MRRQLASENIAYRLYSGKLKPAAYGSDTGFLLWFSPVAAAPRHRKLIGENIRLHRKRAGFSQERLAEKADLHSVYISQVERAERAITIDTLLKITKALGVKLRDIVGDL